jgi:iron complex outermembrane receptor protein
VVDYTGKKGSYCGSGKAQPSFWTVRTGNTSENAYGGLNYELDNGVTVFGDLLLGFNHTSNNTRGPSWTSAASTNGYFFNQNTGHIEVWSRRFSPEELGGVSNFNRNWHDRSADIAVGARGPLGNWHFETIYNLSSYVNRAQAPRIRANIDSFFLGPQQGTNDDGVAVFAPNPAVFNSPLSQSQLASLIGSSESRNTAWSQTLSASANGDVTKLPAGPLQAAVLAEVGGQGFTNKADPQVAQGVFYNTTSVPDAAGSRTRYAAALELRAPIIEALQATLAGRYDSYRFAGRTDGKFTYNAAFEYRPRQDLLLRGNLASSFRAPDMNYIYKAQTKGYYASTTDYYLCKLAGQPLSNCDYANASPGANYTENGSRDLKPENGKSWGLGAVWSPSKRFDASFDYWHFRIDDLLTDLDADTLLRVEADCRTGARDPGSSQCVDALARITRQPANSPLNPNAITDIRVNPINAAKEQTSGFDLTANWRWKADALGDFVWRTTYTKVLTHKYKQFAADTDRDLLHATDNPDWPDKLITSLNWIRGDWSSTVTFIRTGKAPNAAEDGGYVSPTVLTNLDIGYRINQRATVSFTVNNLFDKIKKDGSGGWPYYLVGNYPPIGREVWLQGNYHFD